MSRWKSAALALLAAPSLPGQTVAFPGAEGFGRFASGGRGGDVYVVTNLNDSGSGSLREGVTNRNAATPRTVVFAVSGTIPLESTLRITKGNLTIAGQTAPGDGICLSRHPLDPSNTTNVIIRFLRSRLGNQAGVETDAFTCRYAEDVIIDHCSFSWSVDEAATAYDNRDFTMQWCIVSESMRESLHDKGAHGYGGIWGGMGATFHHNLIAHHDSRNPRLNGARYHGTADELVDFRNNVIYNWRGNSCYGGEPASDGTPARVNLVGNYYKNGPATGTGAIRYRILEPTRNTSSTGAQLSRFHVSGNHTTGSATVTADNWAGGVQVVSSSEFPNIRSDAAFETTPLVTQPATGAYPLVLAHAGCRLPARDAVDTRIAGEVASGSFTYRGSVGNLAGIIDTQDDVGGWPALASLPAPADSDADGMPDAWESARGLDPDSASDRNAVQADGYTNLEVYLNELAAPAFPIPVIGQQPESQTVAIGSGFSLSVTASGPGPLAYQWHRGNQAIEGATSASYSAGAASADDAGDYHVVVRNGYGATRSGTVTVSLTNQPPAISGQPASLTVAAGQPVAFAVTATGAGPLTYQWYRGERALPDADEATLELGPATPQAAGPYRVVVTNALGAAVSNTATLGVALMQESEVFRTGFGSDTIHATEPVVGPTATNWHVMSSKDARASNIADSRLDLTMVETNSGIVEGAARFTETPVSLPGSGETLRLGVTLSTTNVRTLGIGLFGSGGVLPHTGLMNGQLSGSSNTLATGGTQAWTGYRFHLDANGPSIALEDRPAQSGATNASQSLIVPGTSSSAPLVNPLSNSNAAGFAWTDGATYTLKLEVTRTAADAFELRASVQGGPALVATTSGALLAESFDALAIGYRNREGSTVSRVRVTAVSVERLGATMLVTDPYQAFLAGHELDLNGSPDADPDADGIPNALEFILGGNPHRSDASVSPVLELDGGRRFRFLRHVDAGWVFEVAAQVSTDLSEWLPLVHGEDGVSIAVLPFDATHEQVEILVPGTPGPSCFFRLAASPRP